MSELNPNALPVVATPPVPVLPASKNRLDKRFFMSLTLAVGALITGLPQLLPTLNDMFPHYVKQIGWAATIAGFVWNSLQRNQDRDSAHHEIVNFSGSAEKVDPDTLLDIALSTPPQATAVAGAAGEDSKG